MQDNEIYKYLKENDLTDLDEKSFLEKYSDEKNARSVYDYLKSDGMTDLDFNQFYDKYLKKKTQPPGASPSVSSTEGSASQYQKPVDYSKQKSKFDVLYDPANILSVEQRGEPSDTYLREKKKFDSRVVKYNNLEIFPEQDPTTKQWFYRSGGQSFNLPANPITKGAIVRVPSDKEISYARMYGLKGRVKYLEYTGSGKYAPVFEPVDSDSQELGTAVVMAKKKIGPKFPQPIEKKDQSWNPVATSSNNFSGPAGVVLSLAEKNGGADAFKVFAKDNPSISEALNEVLKKYPKDYTVISKANPKLAKEMLDEALIKMYGVDYPGMDQDMKLLRASDRYVSLYEKKQRDLKAKLNLVAAGVMNKNGLGDEYKEFLSIGKDLRSKKNDSLLKFISVSNKASSGQQLSESETSFYNDMIGSGVDINSPENAPVLKKIDRYNEIYSRIKPLLQTVDAETSKITEEFDFNNKNFDQLRSDVMSASARLKDYSSGNEKYKLAKGMLNKLFPEYEENEYQKDLYNQRAAEGKLTMSDHFKTFAGSAAKSTVNLIETILKGTPSAGTLALDRVLSSTGLTTPGMDKVSEYAELSRMSIDNTLMSVTDEFRKQQMKVGKSFDGQYAQDIARTIGDMMPTVVASIFTGGGAAAQRAVTFVGTYATTLPKFYEEARNARLTGAAYEIFANGMAGIEAFTESILPVDRIVKSNLAVNILKDLEKGLIKKGEISNYIADYGVKHIANMLKNGTAEEIENIASNVLSPFLGKLVNAIEGKDKVSEDFELTNLDEVITTFGVTGLMGAPSVITQTSLSLPAAIMIAESNPTLAQKALDSIRSVNPSLSKMYEDAISDFMSATQKMPTNLSPKQKLALYELQNKIEKEKAGLNGLSPEIAKAKESVIRSLQTKINNIVHDPSAAEDVVAPVVEELSSVMEEVAPMAESKPARVKMTSRKDNVSINEVIGYPVTYKGKPATVELDGKTVVVKMKNSNREYEIGNVDEIGNLPVANAKIEYHQSVVGISDNNNITVRGIEYKNKYINKDGAINYDEKGNVISVNLETQDGRKRTFRGPVAEDIAYQIKLQSIYESNESTSELEQLVDNEVSKQDAAAEAKPATEKKEDGTNTESVRQVATVKPAEPITGAIVEAVVDGEQVSGVVVSEDGDVVKIKDEDGQEHTVDANSVDIVDVQDEQQEPEMSDLAKELDQEVNKNDFDENVKSIEKSLSSIGVKVSVVEDIEDWINLAEEFGAESDTQGFFFSDGIVYLNKTVLEDAFDANIVVWHEATHPVINIIRNTNPDLFNRMLSGINQLAGIDPRFASVVNWAAENYSGQSVADEAVVEAIARIASGDIVIDDMPPKTKSLFIDFINKILEILGIDPISDKTDKEEFLMTASVIANTLKSGEDISNIPQISGMWSGKEYMLTIDAPELIGGGFINLQSRITDSEAINVYEPKGVDVLQKKSLKEVYDQYGGKAVVINSDPTRVGELILPSGKKIFMYGGPGYLSISENVKGNVGFATTQTSKVKSWMKYVNDLFGDATGVTLVATQAPTSILSNSYALRYVMDGISQLPKSVLRSSDFKNEFFRKDLTLLKEAFGEKSYNDFVKKYKKADLSDHNIIDDMISEMAYKIGDDNKPASFKARGAFVSNLLGGIEAKKKLKTVDGDAGYVSKKPTKYISSQLFNRLGINTERVIREIGEPALVDIYMNEGKWGMAVSGFETDPSMLIDEVQSSGIKHPLFNAKFPGKNPFILDGAYEINQMFSPIEMTGPSGAPYTKTAAQMLAGSMYVRGQSAKTDNSFEYQVSLPVGNSIQSSVGNRAELYRRPLKEGEINRIRASLRMKAPYSATLEYLDTLQEMKKSGSDIVAPYPEVDDMLENGISVNDVSFLLIEDGIFNNINEARRYLLSIGGFDKVGVPDWLQTSAGNRGQLLAPNGRPSNLTPFQYHQVRTKEFKNWFGDWENDPENASKVVDENGEPMVVYHGSNKKFDEFKKVKSERGGFIGSREVISDGFFFTADKDYALKAAGVRKENDGGSLNIFNTFLNAKNILDLSKFDYESEMAFKNITGDYPHEYFGYHDSLDQWWRIIDDVDGIGLKLKELGYDAVYLAETTSNNEAADVKSIAVFYPNQIKSATANSGAFNPNDNRIQFSKQRAERVTSASVFIAPMYSLKANNFNHAQVIHNTDYYKRYIDDINEVASTLSVAINETIDTLGSFQSVSEASTVVSATGEFDNIVKFAAVMSALAPEVQEAAIAATYVEGKSKDHNATMYEFSVQDPNVAMELLDKAGVGKYGYTLYSNKVHIFELLNSDTPQEVKDLFYKAVDDFKNEYNKKYGTESEYGRFPVKSEYIGREERLGIIAKEIPEYASKRREDRPVDNSVWARAYNRSEAFANWKNKVSRYDPVLDKTVPSDIVLRARELHSKQIEVSSKGQSLSAKEKAELAEIEKELASVIEPMFSEDRDVYLQAKSEIDAIAEDLTKIVADSYNADYPIKRPSRASVKTVRWYDSQPNEIGDGSRTTIIVKTEQEADFVFDQMSIRFGDTKGRSERETTNLGYPKRLMEVRTSTGKISEIQVMVEEAYIAKDGVKNFPKNKRAKAAKHLREIWDSIGYKLPDGVGHYFYELNRDPNVQFEIRTLAEEVSKKYYDVFLNPESKVTESELRDGLSSLYEMVEAADKSGWDKGNNPKLTTSAKQFIGIKKQKDGSHSSIQKSSARPDKSKEFKIAAFVFRKKSEGAPDTEISSGLMSVLGITQQEADSIVNNPSQWLLSKFPSLSDLGKKNLLSLLGQTNMYRARNKSIGINPIFTNAFVDQRFIEEAKKRNAARKKSWSLFLSNFKRKYMDPAKGLPDWVLSVKETSAGSKNVEISRAKKTLEMLAKEAKKIGFTDWDAFSKALSSVPSPVLHQMSSQTGMTAFNPTVASLGRNFTIPANAIPSVVPQAISALPASIIPFVYKMRAQIDGLTSELIASGSVNPEQAVNLEKNIGSYMNRAYKMYNEKGYKPSEQIRDAARRFLVDTKYRELLTDHVNASGLPAPGGFISNALSEELMNQAIDWAEGEIDIILSKSRNPFFNQSSDSRDTGILKERKVIPEPIRKLMGEYTDPGVVFMMTVSKQAALLSTSKYFQKLRDFGMGVLFFERNDPARPSDYSVQISTEGSESKNPLGGLYTTKEIAEALDTVTPTYNDLTSAWMKIVGVVRWTKTVGSPVTQFKNFESNLGFAVMNGLIFTGKNTGALNGARKYFGGEYSSKEISELTEKVRSLNLVGQSVTGQMLAEMLGSGNVHDIALELALDKPGRRITKILKAPINQANKLYRLSDDFWKVYAYLNEREVLSSALFDSDYSSLSDENKLAIDIKSSERVKNTWPTYDRVWEAAKYVSKRAPIFGNFLSFQAESIRVLVNTIKIAAEDIRDPQMRLAGAKRIAGILSYLSIRTGVTHYVASMAGIAASGLLGEALSSDEEKRRKRGLKTALPPYMRTADVLVDRGPDPSKFTVYSLSSIDPYGIMFNSMNAITDGRQNSDPGLLPAFSEFFGSFMEPEMTFETLWSTMNNTNIKTGENIYLTSDSTEDKINKTIMYVWDRLEPSVFGLVERGMQRGWAPEAAAAFGLRPVDVDLHRSFSIQLSKLQGDMDDISKEFNKVAYNKDASEEDRALAEKVAEQKKAYVINRLHEVYTDFIALGADPEVLDQMISSRRPVKVTGFDKATKKMIKTGVTNQDLFYKLKR